MTAEQIDTNHKRTGTHWVPVLLILEFFRHSHQQNTKNDNSNEDIGLPVQLLLQEDTGQQQ